MHTYLIVHRPAETDDESWSGVEEVEAHTIGDAIMKALNPVEARRRYFKVYAVDRSVNKNQLIHDGALDGFIPE